MLKRLTCLALVIALLLGASSLGEASGIAGYDAKTKTLTYVHFGRFPTAADGAQAPILWRVLSTEDGVAYLLSEYILEARRIDPEPYPYAGWEKSELYAYLNGDFKANAFSAAEQGALLPFDDGALVNLATIDDLRNEKYGFTSNKTHQAQSTEYAKANGLFVYQGKGEYSPYWSRTVSPNHAYAHRRIMDDGKLGYICVEVKNMGMRPAVLLNLSGVSVVSGEGTAASPYLLESLSSGALEPQQTAAPDDQTPGDAPADETLDAPALEPATAEQAAPGTQAYDPLFPTLTADRFLADGEKEFVHQDTENGVWLYASQDLRIEIRRTLDSSKKNRPLRCLTAEIFVRDGADFMKVYYNEKESPKKEAEIVKIARKNNLVFAINADWYYYRVKRNANSRVMAVGVILRENKILYDDPAKKASSSVPNRDILALFPDGDLKVYAYNDIKAAALQKDGAHDVLSFGPVLVSDGEITAQTKTISARQSNNPRMGLGLVEPGHYVAIMAEGRISESKGCTLVEFAQLFLDKGCTAAYNLDGGGTASMMFMGEYVNKMGSYTADKRLQNEVLGIGQSDAVTK